MINDHDIMRHDHDIIRKIIDCNDDHITAQTKNIIILRTMPLPMMLMMTQKYFCLINMVLLQKLYTFKLERTICDANYNIISSISFFGLFSYWVCRIFKNFNSQISNKTNFNNVKKITQGKVSLFFWVILFSFRFLRKFMWYVEGCA